MFGRHLDSNSRHLILASGSVYRRDLLKRLRLPFDVVAPDVDEAPLRGETAERTALRLAEVKARAVAQPGQIALIIGSDQVAVLDGEKLDKPGSHAKAVRQLKAMRGKSVVFHTALCLYNCASDKVQVANVPTTVTFRNFSDAQIERYLASERPYDCAGSAKIEGLGVALVERVVSDDPTALIGLPLIQLISMLKNEGIAII
jgi:septum formation protein